MMETWPPPLNGCAGDDCESAGAEDPRVRRRATAATMMLVVSCLGSERRPFGSGAEDAKQPDATFRTSRIAEDSTAPGKSRPASTNVRVTHELTCPRG